MSSKKHLLLTLVYATLITFATQCCGLGYLVHTPPEEGHAFTKGEATTPLVISPFLLRSHGLTFWTAICSSCNTICIGGTCGYELRDQEPSLPERRR